MSSVIDLSTIRRKPWGPNRTGRSSYCRSSCSCTVVSFALRSLARHASAAPPVPSFRPPCRRLRAAPSSSAPSSTTLPPYYVTTPIYYVNDAPHIGHAYTSNGLRRPGAVRPAWGPRRPPVTGTDGHPGVRGPGVGKFPRHVWPAGNLAWYLRADDGRAVPYIFVPTDFSDQEQGQRSTALPSSPLVLLPRATSTPVSVPATVRDWSRAQGISMQ